MKYTIDYFVVGVACLLLGAGIFYLLFGWMGVSILIGMVICYGMANFTVFKYLQLETDEKLFIGVFISLGLFPLLVWYLDRIIHSFFMSIIASLLMMFLAGLLIKSRGER